MLHSTVRAAIRPSASFLALVLLVAACGPSTTPSPTAPATPAPTSSGAAGPSVAPSAPASAGPSASIDVDATYDAIEAQVVELRGLGPVQVARKTIDATELSKLNVEDFDKDNPPAYVAANQRLYQALGLLAPSDDLRALFLKLSDSQVAGFYRPDEKTLYVVSRSGSITGADKITFAHEYTHALQDASFPTVFGEQQQLLDQTDEAMAHASIFEGDATILMSLWAIPNLTPQEIGDVQAAGADPEATAILNATPAILRENLLFPYTAGLSFLTPVRSSGGWQGVDAIYDRLPASTEQVIHPDKYQNQEAPIAVTLPSSLAKDLGKGWSVSLQDTFGEAQLRTWLATNGLQVVAANGAAAGWGGDRLAVLEGPDGAWALVMRTDWDTADDAAEFGTAATTATSRAGGPATVIADGDKTQWIVVGSDDATRSKVQTALGLAG
jgi:hypothetical protein